MAKNTLVFTCTNCDAQFPKWSGRCMSCGSWGSLGDPNSATVATEKKPERKVSPSTAFSQANSPAATMSASGIPDIDHVLGGGLVAGSVTLLAGEPGIGKSTLLAQMAVHMASAGKSVVYVTGEESPMQVRRRLERLSPKLPDSLHFFEETQAESIAALIAQEKPDLTIVDSIQSIRSDQATGEPGSVTQVKVSAAKITEAAKQQHAPVILVGQVTKDGDVAGPRVLEHLVDTVLFLEGDHEQRYRILRALKHRFGSTDEIALLTMTERGLESVSDVSEELLRDRALNVSGSAISTIVDGKRIFLLEIQSLVSPAGYATPVRRATGVDPARLGMLLAVLARRAGIQALDKDVYANAVGGIDARDPSIDLALCAAIASAVKDWTLDPKVGMFGEVGLAGELRPVALPDLRIKEFQRLGFTKVIVPKNQGKTLKGLEVVQASTLREALEHLFKKAN